ncbi:MAG: hypothetical protein JXJ20_15435 [Anaerolineae bacterium]|nr:hypothetical protein [Anaerolineae bacterium]
MKPIGTPVRRWELVALVVMLLVAAGLRLGAPGITEFKRDEANLSRLALDLARGRDLPLLGIRSSVDVPNPPVSVYLFALPYALDDTPLLSTLFVGALNVIAVALAWWLARRYYGPLAALVAGALYAAAPWAVIYSRKIWAQDLLPPFVAATVFTGLLGFGEGKRWARWLHWPLLALTVQIHFGAFTLIPLSLLMLVLWWQTIDRRDLVIGLGIAALTMLPALAGAYRDDLLTLDTIRDGLGGTDHEQTISTTALDYARLTIAGTDIHSLAGEQQFQHYLDTVPDVYPLFDLVPLGAALAAGLLVVRAVRAGRARSSPDVVLVAWLVVPVLAFTWEWTEVAPHYMIPLMPAAYILCGAGAAALRDAVRSPRVRRALVAGGALLLAVIVSLQVILFVELLRFLDDHHTPGGFGVPLHDLLDVRQAVLDHQPDDVIVVSEGEIAPYDQEPAVWELLLGAVPDSRFVDGTRTAVIPVDAALELVAWTPALRTCADPGCWEDVDGVQVFELRPGGERYIVRPAAAGAWADDLDGIEPVRFANGAHLTGYALRADSVLLAWQLDGPAALDYQAFVHALDADGQRIAQADRTAWPGRYWRAGDTLYLWFDLVLPPDAVTLRAGMYTTDGVTYHNVETLDAQGAYLGQWADIPLPR